MFAVKQGEFSETLIAHHPGVTTMWLAGLRTFFMNACLNVENLALGRWFIGIIVWAGIGAACLLLYRLFGQWVALASFACLTYSPLFLAQARRVHTDALATTFILLTVLLFLLYCQNREQCRYLILSGIAFGVALLSKSYALILLPWIPLCLFLGQTQDQTSIRFQQSIVAFGCFLSCSLLTVIMVWPVFWRLTFAILSVCLLGAIYRLSETLKKETISLANLPFLATYVVLGVTCIRVLQTVWIVFDEAGKAVVTPHEVEHFFLGNVQGDPGWLFYPFVLTIKSTPLMLPFALIGCILLWKQRKRSVENANQFKRSLALVAGVVLFTLCLSATSKKFSRYLLPAFSMLEILSAIGFVETLQMFRSWLNSHFSSQTITLKNMFTRVTCLGFFFLQVLPVLTLHPYYGTYYNLCWRLTDITQIITMGDAAGLDSTAKYLNQKPNAHRMLVQVSPSAAEFIFYYFQGRVYPADIVLDGNPNPDYEVVYIRDSQAAWIPQEGTRKGELECIITLNGIDYVWIYRIPSPEE